MFIVIRFTKNIETSVDNLLPHILGLRILGIALHVYKGSFSEYFATKEAKSHS